VVVVVVVVVGVGPNNNSNVRGSAQGAHVCVCVCVHGTPLTRSFCSDNSSSRNTWSSKARANAAAEYLSQEHNRHPRSAHHHHVALNNGAATTDERVADGPPRNTPTPPFPANPRLRTA
jgi:hypothetical protein